VEGLVDMQRSSRAEGTDQTLAASRIQSAWRVHAARARLAVAQPSATLAGSMDGRNVVEAIELSRFGDVPSGTFQSSLHKQVELPNAAASSPGGTEDPKTLGEGAPRALLPVPQMGCDDPV